MTCPFFFAVDETNLLKPGHVVSKQIYLLKHARIEMFIIFFYLDIVPSPLDV